MAYFGNWLNDGSAASDKQDVKFDASQYDFFGCNVAEYELEGPNESIKNAPFDEAGNEDYLLSAKQKGKNVDPPSYVDDLADTFAKLNQISVPKRPRDTTKGTSSSKQSSKKAVPQAPKFNQRHAGRIKWFDNQRGFGFITPDAGGVELYVHCSYLKSDGVVHLMPGTRVEYESIPSFDGKMQAINVTAPNNRLLQDCRKRALPDLSTLIGKNTGSSLSHTSGPGLGPCFYCGKWGHISKECPAALQRGTGSYQTPRDKSDELEPGEGWSVLWCYICQNAGHVPNNCVWKRP